MQQSGKLVGSNVLQASIHILEPESTALAADPKHSTMQQSGKLFGINVLQASIHMVKRLRVRMILLVLPVVVRLVTNLCDLSSHGSEGCLVNQCIAIFVHT